MASSRTGEQRPSLEMSIQVPNYAERNDDHQLNCSQRAQWLRAAMLGANDGLVTVSSLMMGVGAVKEGIEAMVLAGFAGLVAGACSMAIGEFVSVYTQRDIEVAQMKRDQIRESADYDSKEKREKLPNPGQAAVASALAFTVGAVVPLLAAAFIKKREVRMAVVVAVASLVLAVFGAVGGVLGRTPVMISTMRVVSGGWMAMGITLGLTKLIAISGI